MWDPIKVAEFLEPHITEENEGKRMGVFCNSHGKIAVLPKTLMSQLQKERCGVEFTAKAEGYTTKQWADLVEDFNRHIPEKGQDNE